MGSSRAGFPRAHYQACPEVSEQAQNVARQGICLMSLYRKGLLLFWIVGISATPAPGRADSLTSALYVRTDTDKTLVVSPRAHASKRTDDQTQLDFSYAADIWTSASVDIRASASKPVTEQRNEIDAAITHELGDLTLDFSYRYSAENDYASQGPRVVAV